jgi:hypothetical protein
MTVAQSKYLQRAFEKPLARLWTVPDSLRLYPDLT